MSKKAKDPRMVYQAWDEDRITGNAWTKVMLKGDDRWHATGTAWDVQIKLDHTQGTERGMTDIFFTLRNEVVGGYNSNPKYLTSYGVYDVRVYLNGTDYEL